MLIGENGVAPRERGRRSRSGECRGLERSPLQESAEGSNVLTLWHQHSYAHRHTHKHTTYVVYADAQQESAEGWTSDTDTVTRAFSCTHNTILRRAEWIMQPRVIDTHTHPIICGGTHTHTHHLRRGEGWKESSTHWDSADRRHSRAEEQRRSLVVQIKKIRNILLRIPQDYLYTFGMATRTNVVSVYWYKFLYLQIHATRIFRSFGTPTCLRQGCWREEVSVREGEGKPVWGKGFLFYSSEREKRTQPVITLNPKQSRYLDARHNILVYLLKHWRDFFFPRYVRYACDMRGELFVFATVHMQHGW
jgi:hypothetical protein